MAERRTVHKKISISEQFNDLSEFAQLLFVLMIPHADDWGVLKGSPRVIRGTVIPLNDDRSDEDVEAALNEMVAQRLIWRYEPDGEGLMLQFRKWEEHQVGLQKRTRPKQKLYHYPPQARELLEKDGVAWDYNEFQANSEKFPEVQRSSPRTEQKGTEEKGTEQNQERPPFSQIFTHVTGVLIATHSQAEEIDAWMEDVSEDWFRQACKAAVDNNARKWAYVRAVLQRCKDEGRAPGDATHKRGRGKKADTDGLPYDDWLKESEAAQT